MKLNIAGLYLVTDTKIQQRFSHLDLIRAALAGGVDVIQLRDAHLSARPLLEIAQKAARLCRAAGVPFIVNDHVDIALAADADGVHLGQQDLPLAEARRLMGPTKIIGGTASTLAEARQVEQAGADYLGFGHIFETRTKKKGYAPRGVDVLREVCAAVRIPVVAIGGIGLNRVGAVLRAGAQSAAVCAAICAAPDPQAATAELARLVRLVHGGVSS